MNITCFGWMVFYLKGASGLAEGGGFFQAFAVQGRISGQSNLSDAVHEVLGIDDLAGNLPEVGHDVHLPCPKTGQYLRIDHPEPDYFELWVGEYATTPVAV